MGKKRKLRNLTARELLEILKKDGWYVVKQKGSHVKTLPIGTIKSILKQAGIEYVED